MLAKSEYLKDFCLILFLEKTLESNENFFIFAQKIQDEYVESFRSWKTIKKDKQYQIRKSKANLPQSYFLKNTQIWSFGGFSNFQNRFFLSPFGFSSNFFATSNLLLFLKKQC